MTTLNLINSFQLSYLCVILHFVPMSMQRMVDEEELQFYEEYMNERDPSILHFLLASGDDVPFSYFFLQLSYSEQLKFVCLITLLLALKVSSKQLRDDLMTMLIAGHETSAAVLTWTFYLLSKVCTYVRLFYSHFLSTCPLKKITSGLFVLNHPKLFYIKTLSTFSTGAKSHG